MFIEEFVVNFTFFHSFLSSYEKKFYRIIIEVLKYTDYLYGMRISFIKLLKCLEFIYGMKNKFIEKKRLMIWANHLLTNLLWDCLLNTPILLQLQTCNPPRSLLLPRQKFSGSSNNWPRRYIGSSAHSKSAQESPCWSRNKINRCRCGILIPIFFFPTLKQNYITFGHSK